MYTVYCTYTASWLIADGQRILYNILHILKISHKILLRLLFLLRLLYNGYCRFGGEIYSIWDQNKDITMYKSEYKNHSLVSNTG